MKPCENCKKEPASVKLTEVVDGQKTKVFLCESCSQKKGVITPPPPLPPAEKKGLQLFQPSPQDSNLTCSDCGMTYEVFCHQSLLGCPQDYFVFEKKLNDVLKKIHGSPKHQGKVPSQGTPNLTAERKILHLKARLDRAVQKEEYEKAAKIRDKITEIEGRGRGLG